MESEGGTSGRNLLPNEKQEPSIHEQSIDSSVYEGVSIEEPPIIVSLVTAVRIPPRHTHVVIANMSHCRAGSKTLFEPDINTVSHLSVQMDPAMVTVNKKNQVTLAIHNPEDITVKVKVGPGFYLVGEKLLPPTQYYLPPQKHLIKLKNLRVLIK